MLAVAVSARAFTADPRIEVTLSPRLRTSPLPGTPAGVADRWTPRRNDWGSIRFHVPIDASVDVTDARNALRFPNGNLLAKGGLEHLALDELLLEQYVREGLEVRLPPVQDLLRPRLGGTHVLDGVATDQLEESRDPVNVGLTVLAGL